MEIHPDAAPCAGAVGLDVSVENVEYFLLLWNLHIQSQVPSYEPGAHGIRSSGGHRGAPQTRRT
jgi:hypothetical protein